MMDENESLLCEALYKDLRKPKQVASIIYLIDLDALSVFRRVSPSRSTTLEMTFGAASTTSTAGLLTDMLRKTLVNTSDIGEMFFTVFYLLVTLLDDTLIHYDPLGVVLIMGAWNYPLMLSLGPLGSNSHSDVPHSNISLSPQVEP